MKLSLVVHAHQPPGNFDSVFHEGVDRCYGPFLDLLEEFEHVRVSLHFSGSLLEWIEQHTPERIEQLRRLVARGQVEPVAAGMYEPVLALLPPHDRAAQLRAHRSYLRRLFTIDAHSGWLTERVWEPALAADLVDGGISVVPLDERHFLSAGLRADELTGPFVTEYQGRPLVLAPAQEELRMAIPWRSVRDAIALLRRYAASGVELAVFGDDMEKFGMWPGTYQSVIRDGWLRRFFATLGRLGEEIELVPLGEAVAATPPSRRIYIPDGSYPEMLAWSLPPARQRDLQAIRERLEAAHLLEDAAPFMRAGTYLQFLAKYPEANHLHKRMLDVSRRVAARVGGGARARARLGDDEAHLSEMQRAIWRAQANCVYWHGWFGGTYLPHLRHAVWRALLEAERALEADGERRRPLRRLDLDADGADEAVLMNDTLTLVIDPGEGGSVVELSDRALAVNLVDTLARRREAYHPVGADAPPYDRGRRALFADRFLAAGPPPPRGREIDELGDFLDRPYTMRTHTGDAGASVTLDRTAAAPGGTARVEKRIEVPPEGGAIVVHYVVEAAAARVRARFGVECNFGVFFQQETRGEVTLDERTLPLRRGGAARSVTTCVVALRDPDIGATITSDVPADVDVRPVFTTSQSEKGMERTAQALACLLSWPVDLMPGDRFEVTLRLIVTGQRGGGA